MERYDKNAIFFFSFFDFISYFMIVLRIRGTQKPQS